jgi:hypothetical protein
MWQLQQLWGQLKGTVKQKLSVVESRLERSVMISCLTAGFFFINLKGHRFEKSIKLVAASSQQVKWHCLVKLE